MQGGESGIIREGPTAPAPARDHDRRSLGALFLELTKETSALVRAEVTLARLEIEEKLSQMQQGVTSLAAGGLVLFAGLLALITCAILVLSEIWSPWAAALVVGLVVVAIGAGLLAYGRSRVKANRLKPRRLVETLRDTKQFAKEQAS
jgi:uncharacterized membrane protein YqjE